MMLIYPGMDNIAHSRTLAYFGKAAHAAARPVLPSDVRIHGIITKGGTLPQVIPDRTTAVVTVRANDHATRQSAVLRVDVCLRAAADMTGARLE